MGFPVKKRMNSMGSNEDGPAPRGLDLLSAAIGSIPQHSEPATRSGSQGTTASASSTSAVELASGIRAESSPVRSPARPSSEAVPNNAAVAAGRSKAFPETLLDILSNPDNDSIISWLPCGERFAIHDPAKFSSTILPKYFGQRVVIFRSFIRKLNRWGFRSVRRGVSGFESTFEQEHFRRDRPELCVRISCRSNPPKAAPKIDPAAANGDRPAVRITPSNSAGGNIASAACVRVPRTVQFANGGGVNGNVSALSQLNQDFPIRVANELILCEMRRQRQRALVQLVHQMTHPNPAPVANTNVVLQDVEERLRRLVSQQQRNGGNAYGGMMGL